MDVSMEAGAGGDTWKGVHIGFFFFYPILESDLKVA